MFHLLFIHIINVPLLLASSIFYEIAQDVVGENDVLMTVDVNTMTECVIQCQTHTQCTDIAFMDGGKCLFLKNETMQIGVPILQAKRIKLFKEPYG